MSASAFEIAWWNLQDERAESFVATPRTTPLFWDDDDHEMVGDDEIEIIAA
jgi:hypothetical protein